MQLHSNDGMISVIYYRYKLLDSKQILVKIQIVLHIWKDKCLKPCFPEMAQAYIVSNATTITVLMALHAGLLALVWRFCISSLILLLNSWMYNISFKCLAAKFLALELCACLLLYCPVAPLPPDTVVLHLSRECSTKTKCQVLLKKSIVIFVPPKSSVILIGS